MTITHENHPALIVPEQPFAGEAPNLAPVHRETVVAAPQIDQLYDLEQDLEAANDFPNADRTAVELHDHVDSALQVASAEVTSRVYGTSRKDLRQRARDLMGRTSEALKAPGKKVGRGI